MREHDIVGIATLSNKENQTVFRYGDYEICFEAPYSLECYTEVRKWDNGYLVVMAKYKHNQKPEEEYIDLRQILQDRHYNVKEFLTAIKNVMIEKK